ncbi:hypothetical protein PSQ19_18125 [Devosia algicola]|uniref:Uncharacterized protein n=1 Tax=Devosia algicola TaxID=3026418 RepID=A0ABY7YN41_9HYPH|nr:hypothetical protein [Devosia algicola]WDR02485.1 hypothetical protein PSQ19_18125 [Devosia algicola]
MNNLKALPVNLIMLSVADSSLVRDRWSMASFITGDIFVRTPPSQTLRAWEPYWDCVSILFLFENSDIVDRNEELPEWRLHWISGIALLRTIGHVLAKVDSQYSLTHAAIVAGFWATLKADRQSSDIFWNFIEEERNNILKTYTFGAKLSRSENGYFIEFADGQDAFQLFREALYWWRYHLELLERELQK